MRFGGGGNAHVRSPNTVVIRFWQAIFMLLIVIITVLERFNKCHFLNECRKQILNDDNNENVQTIF